jgi:hypothetical protein
VFRACPGDYRGTTMADSEPLAYSIAEAAQPDARAGRFSMKRSGLASCAPSSAAGERSFSPMICAGGWKASRPSPRIPPPPKQNPAAALARDDRAERHFLCALILPNGRLAVMDFSSCHCSPGRTVACHRSRPGAHGCTAVTGYPASLRRLSPSWPVSGRSAGDDAGCFPHHPHPNRR